MSRIRLFTSAVVIGSHGLNVIFPQTVRDLRAYCTAAGSVPDGRRHFSKCCIVQLGWGRGRKTAMRGKAGQCCVWLRLALVVHPANAFFGSGKGCNKHPPGKIRVTWQFVLGVELNGKAPDLHAWVVPSPYLTQRHVEAPWYRGNARIPLTSS